MVHKVYLLATNFSGRKKREITSNVQGKETDVKKTSEDMKKKEWTDMFYKSNTKKISKFDCIDNPFLQRKIKSRRNYKLYENSF